MLLDTEEVSKKSNMDWLQMSNVLFLAEFCSINVTTYSEEVNGIPHGKVHF